MNLDEYRANRLIDYIKLYVDLNVQLESKIKNYWNSVFKMLKKKFGLISKKAAIGISTYNDLLNTKMGEESLFITTTNQNSEQKFNNSFSPNLASGVCFGLKIEDNANSALTTSALCMPFKENSIKHKGSNLKSLRSSNRDGVAMKKATYGETPKGSTIKKFKVKSTTYSSLNYYGTYFSSK